MYVNSVVLVVILATFANAQRLVIPGSTPEIEARCRDEHKITDEQWEASSNEQCKDILGETAEGRCYYACILREFKFDNSFDVNALFALFHKADQKRINYFLMRCREIYSKTGDPREGCDAVYYIYKCIVENLGVYPPGVQQPDVCFETPEILEECRKKSGLTEQDICKARNVFDVDQFEGDETLMCYHDCILRLMKYILEDGSINWPLVYEVYVYYGNQKVDKVFQECFQKLKGLQGCELTYKLHKCIKEDFGELPPVLW